MVLIMYLAEASILDQTGGETNCLQSNSVFLSGLSWKILYVHFISFDDFSRYLCTCYMSACFPFVIILCIHRWAHSSSIFVGLIIILLITEHNVTQALDFFGLYTCSLSSCHYASSQGEW
jgi:hypothetical protein